jgi:hypothetical protein
MAVNLRLVVPILNVVTTFLAYATSETVTNLIVAWVCGRPLSTDAIRRAAISGINSGCSYSCLAATIVTSAIFFPSLFPKFAGSLAPTVGTAASWGWLVALTYLAVGWFYVFDWLWVFFGTGSVPGLPDWRLWGKRGTQRCAMMLGCRVYSLFVPGQQKTPLRLYARRAGELAACVIPAWIGNCLFSCVVLGDTVAGWATGMGFVSAKVMLIVAFSVYVMDDIGYVIDQLLKRQLPSIE